MAELQQHVVGGKISEAQSSNKLQFEKQSGPIPPYHNSFPEYTCLSSSTKSFVAGEGGGGGGRGAGGGRGGGGAAYFFFWSGKYRQNERNVDEGIDECLDKFHRQL